MLVLSTVVLTYHQHFSNVLLSRPFNKLSFVTFLITGIPLPPDITNKETETLRCYVNLTWSPPEYNGCQLTMYSIYYQQIQPLQTGAHWHQVNVTEVMRTKFTISLACDKQYKVEISAWNGLGESDRLRPWIIKTKSGTVTSISYNNLCWRKEKGQRRA